MVTMVGWLALSALLVAIIAAWLSSRSHPLVQVFGMSLAVLIVSVCGVLALLLIADHVDARLKVAGLLLLLSFTVIGIASAVSAYRGLKARVDASTRIARR